VLHVVLRAGGQVAVDDLLGGAAAQRAGDPAAQVGLGVAVPVGLGCLVGDAEGLSPGDDATGRSAAAVPADGVQLVDQDDGRGGLLGLVEQVADPAGPHSDDHLDEL
jgi:hypothetical protein